MPLISSSGVFRLQRKGKKEKLIRALRHSQAEVRESAAKALGELGKEEAVIPLIVAMDDWNIDVRTAAIEALGQIGDARAVDPLARAIREKSLQKKALMSLIQIGRPSIKSLAELLPESPREVKLQMINAMGRIGGKSAIEPLVNCLRERDRELQDAAAVALVHIGHTALPALRSLLADRRKAVRGAAIKIMATMNDVAIIDDFLPLLKDENYHIRQLVVNVLDDLGWHPDTSKEGSSYWIIKKNWVQRDDRETALINGLSEDLPEIRLAAVRELEKLNSEKAVAALKQALTDPDRHVRFAVIEALGNSGHSSAIDSLIHVITQGDPELAERAAKSIQKFGNSITNQIIRLSLNFNPLVRKLSAEVLGNIGDLSAVTPLIKLLKDSDDEVVLTAIEALGKIADPAALESMLPFLQHSDPKFRKLTATALGEIGQSLAAESLLVLLRDEQEEVRLAVAKALGKISDPVAVEGLINSLNDSSLRVREAVAEAIGNMGPIAVKPLIAILGDWDKDIQAISKALNTIGAAAIKPLINALSSKETKVSEVAAVLLDHLGWQPSQDENGAAYYIAKKQWLNIVKIGQPAVNPLIDATKDTDIWLRTGAVESLGNIADRSAVEPLIGMFLDKYWNVRDAAVEALVKIGEPAVEQLIEVLNERHPATVEYAARALGAIGDEQAIQPLNDALFDEYRTVRRAAAYALETMGELSSGRQCGNCGKPVPKGYRAGDSCPFCDELLDI